MSISQNVLVLAGLHTALQSGLSWLSPCLLTGDQKHYNFCSTLFKKHHILYEVLFQIISLDIARRWRGGKMQSSNRKWELWKIFRFLRGITVARVRNLYAGNLYFDPDMQKGDTLTGTIHMVIWTFSHKMGDKSSFIMAYGTKTKSREDKLCDDTLLVPETLVQPGYVFRHVNLNMQFQ